MNTYSRYKGPEQSAECDSAIKPTSAAYKFETRSDLLLVSYPTLRFRGCRYAFETFEEYERSVGLGTLLEQRASMGKHTYTGRVAVVSVPGTYSKKAKLWIAYYLQLSVNKNPEPPALRGKITEAVDATSIGQLKVTIDRPHDKDTLLPFDSEEHSVLTVEDLVNMKHSLVLRNWSRNNSKKPVVIYTNNDEKECKRLMNNFSKLKVPHKLRDTYPAKAAALKAQTELLLMKNFTQLKRSELFKNIDAGQWTQVRQIIVHAQLRMYIGSTNQHPPKSEWEDYMMEIHRNARVPKLSDDGAEAWDLDVYKPSHKVLDVSDRTWESTLCKLFPQATEQNYFKNLYGSLRSGAKLFLICFRHNELPCTSFHARAMFSPINSPYTFMLICSSGVDSEVESIVEAWKELTEYDPMSVIYKDLNNPQMCDSGIKPTSELPKFTASARYVFETGYHYS
ncbi:hypothetical protein AA0117_g10591 [Alternaria alternata]|uniref:Uncharacterized protein n=1 Tax=Alternaria alternata TaxID=5599 RepID=A0A4V1WQG9_ALTAL|nr:hypothetical protein AA0117_g10591 [Alternaria alternata]